MSVLFRGQERRDFGSAPAIPPNSEVGGFSIRRVDLSSAEAAMQKIAVASSVNLLASIITTMSMKVYTGDGTDRRRISTPRWLDDLGMDGHGIEDWIWRGVWSWGLRGNIVGTVVERDTTTGKPRGIDMHHPDEITVSKDRSKRVWRVKGKELPADRLFHKRIFPIPGQVLGASPIAQHALTIGTGLAGEQYAAQFYIDGGHPTAIFQNKSQTIDPDKRDVLKRRFRAAMRGNREPIVLGSDWDYKAIQVSPSDAVYLSVAKFTAAECARIYGPGMPEILGYETGGSMTYANIEQRSLDLLTFTADPWIRRVERMLSWLLPAPQFVEFDRKSLVRTDLLTRFRAHEIALRNEFEVVDEVRAVENMPPLPWGQERPTAKTPPPTPVQMG